MFRFTMPPRFANYDPAKVSGSLLHRFYSPQLAREFPLRPPGTTPSPRHKVQVPSLRDLDLRTFDREGTLC